eukprot:2274579-Pyramimonas_sp.AAC.1
MSRRPCSFASFKMESCERSPAPPGMSQRRHERAGARPALTHRPETLRKPRSSKQTPSSVW